MSSTARNLTIGNSFFNNAQDIAITGNSFFDIVQDNTISNSIFQNSHSNYIHGGTFYVEKGPINTKQDDTPVDHLESQVAHAALHDSPERFEAPRCHLNTRLSVKAEAHRWAMQSDNTTASAPVMWLRGGAGAGKSAIAQSLAEEWCDQGLLLASFFFNRSDPSRNYTGALVATLVFQIYRLMEPEVQNLILQAIEEDSAIFSSNIFSQFYRLLVRPLRGLIQSGFFQNLRRPRMVIIDGLDECLDQKQRGEVLQLVRRALSPKWQLPFLFLIASRPEPDIVGGIASWEGSIECFPVNLSDNRVARADIERFLRDKFAECRNSHPLRHSIPPNWPPNSAINALVKNSSGHFIYAAVAVQYVTSPQHLPHHRLEIMLKLRPATSQADTPFAKSDALYSQVLSCVANFPLVSRIISLRILAQLVTAAAIECVLDLHDGDVEMALSDMTSLVSIDRVESSGLLYIQFIHASFQDYLFDSARSGEYHINVSQSCRDAILTFLAYLNSWSPDNEDDRRIMLGCHVLEQCFPKVDIDFALSEFICSTFSLHRVYLNITGNPDLTAPVYKNRLVTFQRVLEAICHVLTILEKSASSFAILILERLRAEFDAIVLDLLDKLAYNNRLKVNIAVISSSVIFLARPWDTFSMAVEFLGMAECRVPSITPSGRAVPINYLRELHLFFTTPQRSGKYSVCPETHTGAAMLCVKLLHHNPNIEINNLHPDGPSLDKSTKLALQQLVQLLPSAGFSSELVEAFSDPGFLPIPDTSDLTERAWSIMIEYLRRWQSRIRDDVALQQEILDDREPKSGPVSDFVDMVRATLSCCNLCATNNVHHDPR